MSALNHAPVPQAESLEPEESDGVHPALAPIKAPGRSLGDVSLAGRALRFECFGCGRRTAIAPHKVSGWPDRSLAEIRRKLSCSQCASRACELIEVIWCKEMADWEPMPWPPRDAQ